MGPALQSSHPRQRPHASSSSTSCPAEKARMVTADIADSAATTSWPDAETHRALPVLAGVPYHGADADDLRLDQPDHPPAGGARDSPTEAAWSTYDARPSFCSSLSRARSVVSIVVSTSPTGPMTSRTTST